MIPDSKYKEQLALTLRLGEYLIDHSTLGLIHAKVKSCAKQFIARWKNGVLMLTVPPTATVDSLSEAIQAMEEKLLVKKSQLFYSEGQRFDFDGGLSIVITRQSHAPRDILATASMPVSSIEVGTNYDFNSSTTTEGVSTLMKRIAHRLGAKLLIPRAREIAESLGCQPTGWDVSTGDRILGKCNNNGVISLSRACVFLPQHLRDYIVCHELAHLSEFNHSPRFHRICNEYCQGRENELIRDLNKYKWPILR